ncbi:MAG: ABC transporter permease [Bryobacteraceae bacterium]|nr:ABC transporter permease [Bryobacteraceae bacterium]MDW8377548.1 ABC transporter permease [Bryobacterales bacterium]
MNFREALRFSVQALLSNKIRTALTALGLLIGNASVILVVTISLTSREFILEQISGVGSNLITAYFDSGNREASQVAGDYVKIADVEAVKTALGPRIKAATGVMSDFASIVLDGRLRDVKVIGSDEEYAKVRNLVQLSGRPLEASDVQLRQRVALLTEWLANKLYGAQQAAVGQTLKLYGLQFTIIGTFKERTDTFGLSELSRESILIPVTVLRYFTPYERIDPLYVQAVRLEEVEPLTEQVRLILESRHRPGANYYVGNLTGILQAAKNIALVLTIVLILIAAIALIISGIGIMNIMLVTVTERTREIGIRMSIGARRRDILAQFLLEAVLISLGGGLLGVLVGVAIPLSVPFFVEGIRIEVSKLSIVIAFIISFAEGLVFGLLPANRAARLNPTEALRYE